MKMMVEADDQGKMHIKKMLCGQFGYAPYIKIPKMKKHGVFDTQTEIAESYGC